MLRKAILGAVILIGLISGASGLDSSSCDNYSNKKCYYDKNDAVSYATKNLSISKWNNYFPSYNYYGGDCTNFVNQALMAGFIGSSSPSIVYNNAKYYDIDYRTYAPFKWYFKSKTSLSHSWKGAGEFFEYINNNDNHNYNGLHLDFLTKDSPTTTLDFRKIQIGDVIFADWNGDGDIDHTMIVTYKSSNSYSGTYVTYQNDDSHTPKLNISLSQINKLNTVFYVYRPNFYNEGGW